MILRRTQGDIFRTLKTVKTVTAELKSKPEKSQDFYTQIVRTIGLNSRFPLKRRKAVQTGCFFRLTRDLHEATPLTPFRGWGCKYISREAPANAGSSLVFRSTHSDNRKIIAFFVRFAEESATI